MQLKFLYTVGILSMSLFASSQPEIPNANTGILYLNAATDTLYVNGAFVNALGATLTNNGQLYIRQTLTNNQVGMASGTGALLLTGNTPQVITGAQPFKAFNLTTNNSSGILLNNNLHVSSTHTFVTGIISTSATPNYLIYEATSSYSGDGNNAHVNGWVKKLGTTNFAFPLGNGTVERTISVTNISVSSEFNARYNAPTPNTNSMLSPIISVDPYEYWTVNQVSGGTAQLFLNWDRSKVMFPWYILSDIRVVFNNGGIWTNRGGSATGNVSTIGNITSTAVNTFGDFTFGSVSPALPVVFVGIWAMSEERYNVVQWKTTRESNIDHFNIQRSADGITYNSIGSAIPGNNNNNNILSYNFSDNSPLATTNWYRIESVDIDGTVKYSQVVRCNIKNSGNAFYVINNPVLSAKINLAIADIYKGDYKYQLINASGQTAQKGSLSVKQGGIFSISINSNIMKGVYVFRLYNNSHSLINKIYIQ